MSLPCLHKGISRLRAEQLLLESKEDGSYLLRDSESLSGAYTLCILYQSRVYQYRIITGPDKKLSIQTRESQHEIRKFVDLKQLVHEYKNRGDNNSLICALKYAIEVQKEDLEPDSEDEEIQNHLYESATQDDNISQQFQKRFTHLDLSCFDGEFVDQLKKYVQQGLSQDVEKLQTSTSPDRLPGLHKLLSHAARNFQKEMEVYLRKVDLCRQLFSISSSPNSTGKLLHDKKENEQLDLKTFLERLGHCQTVIDTVEQKALKTLKDLASAPSERDSVFEDGDTGSLNFRPFVLRASTNRKGPIPPSSFEVKLVGRHGKNTGILMTIDIHLGKLFAVRPNKDVLDDSNTFPHEKVLQLIKNTSNNCRLDVIIEGRKKETYQFLDVREREHFCQLVQRMKNVHSVSEDVNQISLFVGTFNMGDSALPSDVSDWLTSQGNGKTLERNLSYVPHDIYVIGTQESPMTENSWSNRMRNAVVDVAMADYHTVAVCSLWGIRLIVLVKPEHKNKVSHVQQATVKTGIANALGNKGGVGVSFHFSGTSFCFINCHLTSGNEKNTRRNNNFHDILRGLSTSLGQKPLSNLSALTHQFHHVFWFGDLNYRVEEDCQVILKKVKEDRFDTLQKLDQLVKVQENKEAFLGFKEEKITFPPSYRYARGTNTYDWKKVKKTGIRINVPSWCDRVLWKSFPETYIHSTSYGTADSIKSSDHRPVFATFNLGVMTQFVSRGLATPTNKDVKIIFENIQAELKTTSKCKFQLEFHSLCLEAPVLTKANQSNSKTIKRQDYICPEWTGQTLEQLTPIFTDMEYLEDQHILIAVKPTDGDESYGECVIALKSKFSIAAQPFSCFLMHNGEETGRLKGMMHVSTGAGVRHSNKSRKSYELISIDTDPHCYSNMSFYEDADLHIKSPTDRPPAPLPHEIVEETSDNEYTEVEEREFETGNNAYISFKQDRFSAASDASDTSIPPVPARLTSVECDDSVQHTPSPSAIELSMLEYSAPPQIPVPRNLQDSMDSQHTTQSNALVDSLGWDDDTTYIDPSANARDDSLGWDHDTTYIDLSANARDDSLGRDDNTTYTDPSANTRDESIQAVRPKPAPRTVVQSDINSDVSAKQTVTNTGLNLDSFSLTPPVPTRKPRMGQSALNQPTVLPVSKPAAAANKKDEWPVSSPNVKETGDEDYQHLLLDDNNESKGAAGGEDVPPPLPIKKRASGKERTYDSLTIPTTINEWLLDLGLPFYISNFLDNGWDNFNFIGEITNVDMKDIGINNSEHRQRMLASLIDIGIKG